MTSSSNSCSVARVPVLLRELRAGDRTRLESILRATDAFQPREIGVALDLVDRGIAAATGGTTSPPDPCDYRFVVAEQDGALVGYVCYGLSPLTDAVFDLYWIAVDPALHGGGVGRDLLAAVERDVVTRGARMLLIETGGKATYAPTRRFYERAGYVEIARIKDFFCVGDDKVVFVRRFDGSR